MNEVTISGRLTKDAELKHVGANSTALCQFSIAQNMGEGQYAKVHYFDCKAWKTTACGIADNFRKGDYIELRGILNQETWTDKDGGKRSKIVIVVMDYRMDGGDTKAPAATQQAPARQPAPPANDPVKYSPLPEDISIPF